MWPPVSRVGRAPAHMADAARGSPWSYGSVVSASVVGHAGRAPRAPVPQCPGTGDLARQPVGRVTVRYPGLPHDPLRIPLPVARCSALARSSALCSPTVNVPRRFSHLSAGLRSHELWRHSHHRRTACPLGWRRHSRGFIRLSAGCEDTDDLLSDLAQALDTTL